ncbi:MAG: prolyl oligopeptidase family serine peptidase [Cyclobacteriaceae bacterium]|nr:prolyl oligopeptidase family serine peptidase [Cyclobacteriaceae bacterium]
MKSLFYYFLAICWASNLSLTTTAQSLELEDIMRGYEWVGHSPNSMRWSVDSKLVYFNWNPQNVEADSLYQTLAANGEVQKVPWETRRSLYDADPVINKVRSQAVYSKNGDIYLIDLKSGNTKQITRTLSFASNPAFSHNGQKILFSENEQLFSWHLQTGQLEQLTQFISGKKPSDKNPSASDQWLKDDQLRLFEVLREKHRKDSLKKARTDRLKTSRPLAIYKGKNRVSQITLGPHEAFITYRLTTDKETPRTQVMDYVTESGYAKSLDARPKVGNLASSYKFGIYHIEEDTSYHLNIKDLEGIHDVYNLADGSRSEDPDHIREVLVHGPFYSDDGKNALVQLRALDNKDRWICLLDLTNGDLELLDRQTDVAWVQGPGIGYLFNNPAIGWLPDNQTIWFQSEKTGFSHLYTMNTRTKKSRALTKGNFEIFNPKVSLDKTQWYYTSNETHPGERHFYSMPLKGGKSTKLTDMPGRNDVRLSPDEKQLAILSSQANQPWELYLKANLKDSKSQRITQSQSAEFKAYPWRTPKYIKFQAADGAMVPARLYLPPPDKSNGAAVVFVHGAGYLQNAHKWWSGYYREYMFHNFLVDHGYTVLDIDYRGSAGYGRDWRTGIYQFMGGKDLSDQIDGAGYLVEKYQIDPQRMGIYGGSYGGFITLMAMFTEPDVFAAGAALRSVTDWAHYNHPYTANILNQPSDDSLAFVKSSPIYHAGGLKGALLMLHGMVDRNVQFQDVVRLSQRLIELKKENWELAVFPMEGHGFQEPSSWYDEYRRIFQLFEMHLKEP